MKLRRILPVLLAGFVLLTVSLLGTAFGYMFRQTETVETELIPAQVACRVEESFDGTSKSGITVQNTGNVDAYLRVRMVTYWVDGNGDIMPLESRMPAYAVHPDWIPLGDHTYCYKSPVSPGSATTANLLASPMTLGTSAEGYRQVVAVFAEAIQARPGDAVEQAWAVELNADGTVSAGT